jgi:hypothetical protein
MLEGGKFRQKSVVQTTLGNVKRLKPGQRGQRCNALGRERFTLAQLNFWGRATGRREEKDGSARGQKGEYAGPQESDPAMTAQKVTFKIRVKHQRLAEVVRS